MPLRRRGTQARRHPRRRVALPPGPAHVPFEELVAEALAELPPEIRRLLENVAVVIEDEPTAEQLGDNGMRPGDTLYGLYEGTPAVVYGADWVQLPNKITLFRLPLEEDFADPLELADEVRRTVAHELAHHAGIDDRRLR
ncbi:MAG TPA: metallopeptidase family protein, partial [Candidatus Limnocylindrales bacterium]